MTQLRMHPASYNGQRIERDEFAFRAPWNGSGFNPAGITEIVFYCPSGRSPSGRDHPGICSQPITLGEAKDGRWHWDGNMAAPTITPSIGCDNRCGWHGHITNGATNP
jgi:hypothetical protein